MQAPTPHSATIDAAIGAAIGDLVDANHILFHQGIVDAFGHVSVRHPADPGRFFIARNVAPGSVTAHDIVELDVDNAEPLTPNPPRLYLERCIHSEIYKVRADVTAVVHSHSSAVLPFGIVQGARLRPACHMCGFLGAGPPVFEIRQTAGQASDLLIRTPELGAALAQTLGQQNVVLMRGHGCTVVAASLRLAVYRAVYTEVNARLLLHALPLGAVTYLTSEEAQATRDSVESQVDRPWNLWKQLAQRARE
ncbi:MAG: class II aldolase/adducin family protein [Burkholderiaceae bacterium]